MKTKCFLVLDKFCFYGGLSRIKRGPVSNDAQIGQLRCDAFNVNNT